MRTAEAASSKLPPQARGQPNRARDAARRGPVALRSLGGRRRGRGQRASTVSTSATSARRRPGTAPRPEAARARASNSDVLQGEASITSSRRHRVARPAPNRGGDQAIPSRTCDAAHPRRRVRGRRATVREVPCLGGKRAERSSTATDDFVAATIAAYAVPTTRSGYVVDRNLAPPTASTVFRPRSRAAHQDRGDRVVLAGAALL